LKIKTKKITLQIAGETQIGNDVLLEQQSGQFENILKNLWKTSPISAMLRTSINP